MIMELYMHNLRREEVRTPVAVDLANAHSGESAGTMYLLWIPDGGGAIWLTCELPTPCILSFARENFT